MDFINIPSLPKLNNGQRIFFNPNDIHKKKYQEIKNEISNKYHINLPSRDSIIKHLIVTLTHGDIRDYNIPKLDLFIIRSDIKNFFPSINKHYLYQKLQVGNLLKSETLELLKPMFFAKRVEGVPLGLPFSSMLAEVYLENFDADIRKIFQPIFYFRYVDDIILICYNTISGSDVDEEKLKLSKVFAKHFLQINDKKTEIKEYCNTNQKQNRIEFTYLGYHFEINKHKLIISIDNKKLEKIEDKIKKYFFFYKNIKQNDNIEFWKLYYRIKNVLYGITSKDTNGKKMKFGFGFSYRYINDMKPIKNLLNLIRSLIFSCKFSSRKKHIMLSLIKGYEEHPEKLLCKRYDYTSLTLNQRKKIGARLKIKQKEPDINELFYTIYSKGNI